MQLIDNAFHNAEESYLSDLFPTPPSSPRIETIPEDEVPYSLTHLTYLLTLTHSLTLTHLTYLLTHSPNLLTHSLT
jgi:hypothetical protein